MKHGSSRPDQRDPLSPLSKVISRSTMDLSSVLSPTDFVHADRRRAITMPPRDRCPGFCLELDPNYTPSEVAETPLRLLVEIEHDREDTG